MTARSPPSGSGCDVASASDPAPVNFLLIEAHELDADGRAVLRGRRARHVAEVLHAEVGARLRAGVVDGALSEAVVERLGAGEIVLTSMDCDGTKQGYDLELTRAVSEAVEVPVIASGGVGNPSHMVDGVLKGKASAVLVASIFHFGEYTIPETKHVMKEAGIPVRL